MSILLITNTGDITTDFIVKSLTKKNLDFYRFNTDEIGRTVNIVLDVANDIYLIKAKDRIVDLLEIKAVYYRRPEVYIDSEGLSKGEEFFLKSEIFYALEGMYKLLQKAYWVNNVFAIRNAENKLYQLLVAKQIGFNIPNSIITNDSQTALQFYYQCNSDCIIKPIKSGLIEGDQEGVIFTSKVSLDDSNLKRVETCPVYLQSHIAKQYDVRVTIVGSKVFFAKIHSQQNEESIVDWRKSVLPLEHSNLELPKDIESMCLQMTKALSLNYGAIDLILDKNDKYTFLEINPNGQWAWIEKRLGFNISERITQLLHNEMAS